MAKTLHGAGLKKNDVISIIAENRHEFTAIAFGAFYLNAIVAPISTLYTERKFQFPNLNNRLTDIIITFKVNWMADK